MSRKRWTSVQLQVACKESLSVRQVLKKLELKPTGGNYKTIYHYVSKYKIDTSHFKGRAWNKGLKTGPRPRIPLTKILRKGSNYQSYKLKQRLFAIDLLKKRCEECGWSERSKDGRLPLELDHINGVSTDNRIKNLRILCPNCHSLKPNYRGRNTKRYNK